MNLLSSLREAKNKSRSQKKDSPGDNTTVVRQFLRDLLVEGYRGIRNNESYPPFSYPRRPPQIYSGYGTFLNEYYETIYRFVDDVVETIPKGDHAVACWANYIHQQIPGFPSAREIFVGKTLTEVVAFYIWDVTVGHTIDHHNYGQMDVRKVPLRIRQAPPVKETKLKKRSKLQSPIDLMKYQLAMKLFFAPTVLTKLKDVDYKFNSADLIKRQHQFKEELRATDKRLRDQGLTYMTLDNIAASIQF